MWLLRGARARTRPLLGAGGAFLAYHCHSAQSDPAPNGITPSVHAELEKLRPLEAEFRRKWLEDESGWHKLPPRAWPPTQPKHDELDELKRRAETEGTEKVRFDLATCLTFNGIDPVDVNKSYRFEQGFTFELNLIGVADEARDAFVEKRDANFHKS